MRRNRDIRNYRDSQIHRPKVVRKQSSVKQPKKEQIKITPNTDDAPTILEIPKEVPASLPSKEERRRVKAKQIHKNRKLSRQPRKQVLGAVPAANPISIKFVDYNTYKPSQNIVVCHLIDSLGLGGAQVMTMELLNALGKYYPDNTKNMLVCLVKKQKKYEHRLYSSYNTEPIQVTKDDLASFLESNHANVVVHHRTAHSRCIKSYLPNSVKYILVNHTWNNLYSMKQFVYCDFYVSVCHFLHKKTSWHPAIHNSRKCHILNGVENDFINDIAPAELEGEFKTGRCHRLTPDKFRLDSLTWLSQKSSVIKGMSHYLMGFNAQAEKISKGLRNIHYVGPVVNRDVKFSIVKSLDTYFYETFQDEGASIAVLEALASGVPVICKPKGGNPELIIDGINGFLVSDRSGFQKKLEYLSNPKHLMRFKNQTSADFANRLHVKFTACKYMQIFENLLGK